jgi:hypothetical protein
MDMRCLIGVIQQNVLPLMAQKTPSDVIHWQDSAGYRSGSHLVLAQRA